MTGYKSGTPGGNRLRALREFVGKTQLDVELDGSLGSGYLQRVESGKVQHPERDTLERILAALNAQYTERRAILELFGYLVDAPLPDEEEAAWAIKLCKSELASAVFPAYLLDCAHRVLVWNAFFPKLYPIPKLTDYTRPGHQISMLRILYDAAFGVVPLIANPDVFFPASIRALRSEMQAFHGEDWYDGLINDLRRDCPTFEKYWSQSMQEPTAHIAARPLTPMEMNLPDAGFLQFRILAEPFTEDRRFRVIYCLPADPVTMEQCLRWSR